MREQGDSKVATANGPGIGAQNNRKTNSKVQKQNAIIKRNKANIISCQNQNAYGIKIIKGQENIIINNNRKVTFIKPKTHNNALKI